MRRHGPSIQSTKLLWRTGEVGNLVFAVFSIPATKVNVKVEPTPYSEVAVQSPPSRRARLREMTRPSPGEVRVVFKSLYLSLHMTG